MQIIISHLNLDFDGLASMVAAGKLYPKAKLVLPDKASLAVQRFLALYRDSLNLHSVGQIDWDKVQQLIMVDTANLDRVGTAKEFLQSKQLEELIVYDHHQPCAQDVRATRERIEQVGATVTILIEELRRSHIPISSFEATIMALGLYTDTGSFSYLGTTGRDLHAGAYLLEQGANLGVVARFSERPLLGEQQELFNALLANSKEHNYRGIDILISWHSQKEYQGSLALLARKLIEVTGVHGLFLVVEMAGKVYVVARSNTDLLDVNSVAASFGGGGHAKAASATIKKGSLQEILRAIEEQLAQVVRSSVTAKDIMSSPVKTVTSQVTIREAAKVLLRYGHTGLPVVEGEQLVGIISRRDVDKANHHGLGHAPVKGYMSRNVLTIGPQVTLEEIQNLMIQHNVGRLPVLVKDKLVGIVSRTDVLNYIHGENVKGHLGDTMLPAPIHKDVVKLMEEQLAQEVLELLQEVGRIADSLQYIVYLVGGVVRDLLLGHPSEDIDLMVEGDGIHFAKEVAARLGGKVTAHEKFGTATWIVKPGFKLDVTTARREYYDYPAALPTVEWSDLREDLFRRDFTVNAMAIQLNGGKYGCVIDYFSGYPDLERRVVRTLYNLSFVEDPTRILRAVRFEQRLGFVMDSQTQELAVTAAHMISSVGEGRIATELKLLFREEHPLEAIERLSYLGIWDYLIGDDLVNGQTMRHLKNYHQLLAELAMDRKESCLWLGYLAMLFYQHPQWKTKIAAYSLNKAEATFVSEIIELEQWAPNGVNQALSYIHMKLKGYSPEAIAFYTALQQAQEAKLMVSYLQARNKLALPLKGVDLKAIGLKPGPAYSQLFSLMEEAVLDGVVTDRESAHNWLATQLDKLSTE